MSTLLAYASVIAAGIVFLVLCAGLYNLVRTQSSSRSQTLMRWRVGLQFVAILLVLASALIAKYG